MRRILCGIATAFGLLMAAQSSSAAGTQQRNELLLPVSKEIVAKLERRSNFDLRAQLYPAKRHRFVEINFALLDAPDADFTITPFPDLRFEVSTEETAGPGSTSTLREWRGIVVNTSMQDMNGEPVTTEVSLFIRSGEQEVPLNLVRDIAAERGDKQSVPTLPSAGSSDGAGPRGKLLATMDLTTASGDFWMYAKDAHIVIAPVSDDPRYHVVYEEDQEKIVSSNHDRSPDAQSKGQRHEEFSEQLKREREAASK